MRWKRHRIAHAGQPLTDASVPDDDASDDDVDVDADDADAYHDITDKKFCSSVVLSDELGPEEFYEFRSACFDDAIRRTNGSKDAAGIHGHLLRSVLTVPEIRMAIRSV